MLSAFGYAVPYPTTSVYNGEKCVNSGTIVEIPFLIKAIIIGIWLY